MKTHPKIKIFNSDHHKTCFMKIARDQDESQR